MQKTCKNQRARANIMTNIMCNACLILLKNMYLKLFYVLLYAFQTVLKTSDHLGSHSATPHKLKCALRGKLYEHYVKNSNISNHKTFV
ncbi:hypothetical protein CJ214_01210 [Peptoniphilus lacrimalis]|uniref:Uncharacterized protein n=3 Tax=Gardnerella TaxID=2701 RepID=A0A2I1QDZ9_GARVA|nr:hypothetical protein HMPREF1586_00336 [Gardnerella vaginalis JCP8522]EPI46559.1 hypothetical protein HMPREF1582_01031 [Gardnerella vaginalis JCP8151A]EPI52364.1 hypothetical protein HMPREF1577_00753 [Gardnerella pickettii JCP8017A]EPI61795.1 hypothetical protein HMPREF1578_00640 [Gardnerella pickettii JCP8017B]PKZ55110.1 hypothetical protein CYJ70_01810 [Gardnerella pickettii]PKZ60395.1 hypothetical protein CYJ61_03200 [Gardnerella vaginalis]PMC45625.1 hypothetical protein CJ214_01210 [Pep